MSRNQKMLRRQARRRRKAAHDAALAELKAERREIQDHINICRQYGITVDLDDVRIAARLGMLVAVRVRHVVIDDPLGAP